MSAILHFAHPGPQMPVIVRRARVVQVRDKEPARSEFECVKVGTDAAPAEYDVVLYLHTAAVMDAKLDDGDDDSTA